jgi:hypothetical protein
MQCPCVHTQIMALKAKGNMLKKGLEKLARETRTP